MMQTMEINYDRRFDTLYVALSDKSNSYGDESVDDIILMRDICTDAITGFTILSFFRKYRAKKLPNISELLGLSIERDILPMIQQ